MIKQRFDFNTAVALTTNGKAKKVVAMINGTTLTGKVTLLNGDPHFKPLNGSISKFRQKFGNARSVRLTEDNTTELRAIGCKRRRTENQILRKGKWRFWEKRTKLS